MKQESEFTIMSYISKKNRNKSILTPTVMLAVGMTTPILGTVVASADTTETGWDVTGKGNGNIADSGKGKAGADANADKNAKDKADKNTANAPATSGSSKTGWVDVYVDHTNMDDAIKNASSQGLNIVRDATVVQTGDAEATKKNTADAEKYYADQAKAISDASTKYTNDIGNYNAAVAKNKADADSANGSMDALRTNLAAQGQTNNLESKQYSAAALAADTAAVNKSIADGKTYLNAKNALSGIQSVQNSMVLFDTAASQGDVKINVEKVTIANQADADKYAAQLQKSYTDLQTYLNSIKGETGSIPDSQKPTFTKYAFTIDSKVEAAGTAPVTTYRYTAVPVTKPVTPTINYHYFDIRSQPTGSSSYDNKDGENIVINPNANAGGKKVAQAMVNQTVGIDTDNQPIPSERFDKIEDLTIVTKLPKDVKFDAAASNTDPTNWTLTYDEASGLVTQSATAAYLVQVNLNQNANNGGTIGGTTHGEWKYDAPSIFFKLLKDDTTYQASSTTIVNKEYMFVGEGIQIRTDSADPDKANTNSKYQNIDGKAVLPGSINNYVLGWDFNQYKGVNIDREMQSKGLHLIDDFPEDAVSLTGPISIVDPTSGQVLFSAAVPNGATAGSNGTFNGADGKAVQGLTWKVIDDKSAPDDMKGKLHGLALMVSYTGTDGSFYKTYVEGGKSLNVVMPMTTKKIDNTPNKQGGTYNGNSYSNVAWQSDFGNAYKSNEVKNTAPTLDPKKDVVISYGNLTSLDINNNAKSTIENGTFFKYLLTGSKLPTNLSEDLNSYVFTDDMPSETDEYQGEFIVQTNEAIVFKAGSTLATRYPNGLPANSDISKYFTQTVARDAKDGAGKPITRVTLSADADFLSQIDYSKTPFQVEAFLTTKRIKNVNGVKNVFNEQINKIDFGSNEVVTNSRPNAIDVLNDEIKSLTDKTNSNAEGIKSNATDIKSLGGALSVIVKTVTSLSSSTSSAISSVASEVSSVASSAHSDFDYTNKQISLVSSQTSSAVNSIASSAHDAIASNSTKADSIASSATSATSSVADSFNSAIASIAGKLEVKSATMTIYDSSVVSEANALTYAVNHGVKAGSIESIKKNTAGKYVVTYNVSKTSINGSDYARVDSSDTKDDKGNGQEMKQNEGKTSQITFYTLKSKDEVIAQLAKLGYDESKIKSITPNGSVFTAFVYSKK